jgi:hypothetical protein
VKIHLRVQAKILPGPDAPGIEIRYRRVEKSGSQFEKGLKMARHLDRNFIGAAKLNRENALGARQAHPARTSYTWKEVFGDAWDGTSTSDQACETNPIQSQAPEVAADEFETIYLWFLA